MLSRLLVVSVLASVLSVLGQVAPGENLILNGDLEADQVEFPLFWTRNNAECVIYEPNGGPGGKASITLRAKAGEGGEITARQPGLKLVAGRDFNADEYQSSDVLEKVEDLGKVLGNQATGRSRI